MARELPIHNGRLTTDLDADGHRIKNLSGGGTDTVSWDNVTGKPSFATVATSGSYNDLDDKPTIPAAQVNADWDAVSGVAQILNKPEIIKPSKASDDTPLMDGTAFAGNEDSYSRSDHVHPTDTSRQAALSSQQLANIAAVPSKYEKPSGGIPATDLAQAVQTALSAIPGKADAAALAALAPKYPMVGVTQSNGTLTVTPYTVATYTAGDSAESFTVAVGTGTSGVARDCELVIDCTATGAVVPTVTWPSNFHPRTDADDFACEAGARNVYYISEYASGEFVVGGWQETTGGNA